MTGEERDGPHATHLPALLARAAEAGVTRMVCVGTGAGSSAEAVALARATCAIPTRWPPAEGIEVWATVGLHPHDAVDGVDAARGAAGGRSREPAPTPRTGGSTSWWWRSGSAASTTTTTIRPAPGSGRRSPARSSWPTATGWPWSSTPGRPGTTPSTSWPRPGCPSAPSSTASPGGRTRPAGVSTSGPHISFSGVVTFKNAADVREAAALCPLDRLLVETDTPFLAPVPHRGTANEPSRVPLVGAAIAQVKGWMRPRWPPPRRPTPGPCSASEPLPVVAGRDPARRARLPVRRVCAPGRVCLTSGLRPLYQRSFCFASHSP